MTFELLEAIIVKNKIPKNVRLVNDSENDLCTTDMNGIQYCEKRNEICFMESEYINQNMQKMKSGNYCGLFVMNETNDY